jgi:hypothetical protein
MMVNEMVQIHKGNNLGGVFIHEEIITGTIVKVNKKSIRVCMGQAKCLTNGKVTREYNVNEEATFSFWKTIVRQFGENAGKTVDIYKNSKYGIIEIAH